MFCSPLSVHPTVILCIMKIDLHRCAELLNSHDEFLILSHEHPDGDTLGCAFALCEMLRSAGKKRSFRCADEITANFHFLTDGFTDDEVNNPFVISVDVADADLLGSLKAEYGEKVDLCIDHHGSNTFYATDTLVEDRAAACEIIFELAEEMNYISNEYFRNCIYTGISTDTGCFRYQNTTSHTFKVASILTEQGVDSKTINKLMFETKTKSFLELERLARETLEYYFDDKCAVITVTQSMYEKSGADETQCHPITALPRQIEGVIVGAVLKEKNDGTFSASVRTDGDVDASEVCARLGGGGHKGAAGCRFECGCEESKNMLLDSIKKSLDGLSQ